MKKILGIIFGCLFLVLIFYNLNFNEFSKNIVNFKVQYILIFIPIYIINQYFKGIRWKILVNNENFNYINSFFLFSIGNMLNICMPCRFGDFWKAYKTGEIIDTPKTQLLGTLVTERALDFISIMIILIYTVLKYLKTDFTFGLINSALLTTGIILLILLSFIFAKYITKSKILENIFNGIKSFGNFKSFCISFSITMITRFVECLIVYILVLGTGLNIGFSAMLFVIVFNAFAGMIPSISNYIGAYQYSYILALGLYNVNKSTSLAIVIIYEFLTLSILGIIYLIYLFKNMKKL